MKYTKIKDIQQYNRYCEQHEKLTFKDYESNQDEIELIEILIDEYENRTIDYSPTMNPVELLRTLLEDNELTKSQLAREIKVSRQLVSDILNYKRNISKAVAEKLSQRFKMEISAFSRTYKLKRTISKRIKQGV